jgi:hypothetical protein
MNKYYKKSKSNVFYTLLSLVIYRIKRIFVKEKPREDIHFDVLNGEEFDY